MKSLTEFLMEAGKHRAGRAPELNLDPVISEVWKLADQDKFVKILGDLLETEIRNEGWEYSLGDQVLYIRYRSTDVVPEDAIKNIKKNFGITLNDDLQVMDPKYFSKLGVKLPSEVECSGRFDAFGEVTITATIKISDIQDIWDEYNPVFKLDFEKFGTPGGPNDAVGRKLQPNDIVAFMRRAGTGGMEVGIVTSVAKRVTMTTEVGNTVTLDGSQICLVKRDNDVVK